MVHLPHLIEDLGLIIFSAAVVSLICKKLRQPVVLGYLIAGFIVGPNFVWFLTVKDTKSITIWAELGVIFMLFSLGLEFSFKKLKTVGSSAAITACFEIFAMIGIGFLTGELLGWSKMDSIFLGGILSISSTTIIARAFDELKLKGRNFVNLVFGVLIIEDLLAVLLLVLLSSVAVTKSLIGYELLFSSLKLGFFLILWFLLGIYLLPILLKKFNEFLSDETTLIISIALCLLMVIIASKVGFSPALGAFVMGSILSETSKGHHIEKLIVPVKDLFSAIFFVSVGMLLDPKVIYKYFWVIILLSVLVILGKFIATTIGALISGRNLKHSLQAGLSLTQIGEFSFIIAKLGIALKVTSSFLYPIAVSVSAITTFATPYLIKHSIDFYRFLDEKFPRLVKDSLTKYEIAMSKPSKINIFGLIAREYGIKILLNTVMVVAITLCMHYVTFYKLKAGLWVSLLLCIATIILISPFLWAIVIGAKHHKSDYDSETLEQLSKLQIGISIIRFLLGFILVAFVVSKFISLWAFSGILVIGVASIVFFFFSRFSEPIYQEIEDRFISHLSANERAEMAKKSMLPELKPWNAVWAEFVVSPESSLVAKSLKEAALKEDYGVTVTMIQRGKIRLLAPDLNTLIMPGDIVYLIGTDEQLFNIKDVIERTIKSDVLDCDNFGLVSVVLNSDSPYIGKPIRDSGIKQATNGVVVALERESQRYLSPNSSMFLKEGDLVWLFADKYLVSNLQN